MFRGPVSSGSNNGIKGNRKQLITDFNGYLGLAKQASDYETTTHFLTNHINKTYEYGNDIGIALDELEPLNTVQWKPQTMVSAERDSIISKSRKPSISD
jgi:hypothetical protein